MPDWGGSENAQLPKIGWLGNARFRNWGGSENGRMRGSGIQRYAFTHAELHRSEARVPYPAIFLPNFGL